MKRMKRHIVVAAAALAALLLLAPSCGRKQQKKPAPEPPKAEFTLPQPPGLLDEAQRRDYMKKHFWDNFKFDDGNYISALDTGEVLKYFCVFAEYLSDDLRDAAPVENLMAKAAPYGDALRYFSFFADRVFHDPNSPYRNDEFYIPVLRAQLESPFYTEAEKISPEMVLRMIGQNRLGTKANDFTYALANGRRGTLYGIQAPYVLIFFNNPGCEMCRGIREEMGRSQVFRNMIDSGRLKVLAVYPDEDLEAWRGYAPNMPSDWINAYDPTHALFDQGIYNLAAIPSLYLLDASKTVLAKDVTDVPYLESLLR